MPPMPFPVSRSGSVLAVERLLNDEHARPVARQVLSDPGNEYELAQAMLDAAPEGSPARKAIEEAWRAIGRETMREVEWPLLAAPTDQEELERGRFHVDEHWFKPQEVGDTRVHFWWKFIGEPASILRRGLLKAIEVAGDDLPVHIVWACASPTFEFSISEVKDRHGRPAAVSVVMSTPGTIFSLAHLSDADEQDDPLLIQYDDDQVLIGRRGFRNGDVVHQTGRSFEFPTPSESDC